MNCYVTNPIQNSVLPPEINKGNTMFYPEEGMTTMQCLTTLRPRDYHIVTDCLFFVGLYDNEEVFVWRNGRWVHPGLQTYGASHNILLKEIFGYKNTIPQACIDSTECTNCMGTPL